MKTYIKPQVKLIDNTKTDLGYLLWLKSRQWIIKDLNNNKFMIEFNIHEKSIQDLPSKFYVGDELIEVNEYYNRISKMNLQYMNFDQYIFEIDGSCLFRDTLFNVNKLGQWSQSNRFLFSILNETERFNEEHYHISEEYKDIAEWEDQFDKYMEAIKNDPIVDHNRIEMPYSISSTFWISINKKTLFDLLSFLKYKSPFFYDIYGKQFIKELNLSENVIPLVPSAAITQYIMKDPESFSESTTNINGTYIVNSKMGLILYSQFIRQADTKISGFYNLIMHNNSDEFVHKVFKGGTVFNISYVADEDKIKSTVKTRLCAFAMSSGDDPCSWSYFIKNFLPDNLTPKEFMNYLPCKFIGNKLVNCKFHDDIKFRNEGKEISNCPCPLVTLSSETAKAKLLRDKNRIGRYYYDLTNYLIYDGLINSYEIEAWTSKLIIKSYKTIDEDLIEQIKIYLDHCYSLSTKFSLGLENEELNEYKDYFHNNDNTCILKGYFIDMIIGIMNNYNHNKYLISFGGDIFCNNAEINYQIEGTKFFIKMSGIYSIFTSGNTDKRGNHIIGGGENSLSTVLVKWKTSNYNNALVDALATKSVSNEHEFINEINEKLLNIAEVRLLNFKDGSLLNATYCASPFFNSTQISIRDNMIKNISSPFRPDLTESSKLYNDNMKDEYVGDVINDNIKGIIESNCIVFPLYTDDLGTLFEVGYALAKDKIIFKYDHYLDTYQGIWISAHAKYDTNENLLFDCSKKSSAVELGYCSSLISKDKIFYELKGNPDNIMLSYNYNHIEKDKNGKYKLIIRDKSSRDE